MPTALRCAPQVTKKDKSDESNWTALRKALGVTWPHLLYCAGFIAGQCALLGAAAPAALLPGPRSLSRAA